MANPSRRTITRQELYELVWEQPLYKIADDFGVKKSALISLCLSNNVPRPDLGYWGQKALGKPVVVTDLPEPEKNEPIEIHELEIAVRDPELRRRAVDEIVRLEEAELFHVSRTLKGCHRFVSQTRTSLMEKPCLAVGVKRDEPEECLAVSVSHSMIPRALRIMDAIVKGFERLGYKVVPGRSSWRTSSVEVDGVRVPFYIKQAKKIRVIKTERVEPLEGLEDTGRERRSIVLDHTGPLTLEIELGWSGIRCTNAYSFRRHWGDTKTKRLEDCLKLFAASVIGIVAAHKEALLWEKQRELELQEEKKRLAELEKQRAQKWSEIQIEREKVALMLVDSEYWSKSRRLRQYIKAARMNAIKKVKDVGPDSDFGRWLIWAEQQADRLDPLQESPYSIIDDAEKYRPKEQGRY